jgi:two-component system CheB/CheR fusion protein
MKRSGEEPVKGKKAAGTQNGGKEPAAFPIVAVGASAGGLEALEEFFEDVPLQSGLAFVVIQHLDPTHDDMLAELLQRRMEIPVNRIEDGMTVEPDHVYVIPPNRDLSILNGVLYLLELSSARGPRQPIDFFFRALAEDCHERSVAVILSGMGTDGTLGARAIKDQCGVVFVQDPKSAKFDSMPRSAIKEGVADVVAPAGELVTRIGEYFHHASLPTDDEAEQKETAGMEKVLILLRRQTGHDFSPYKRSTLWRRIERRMNLHHIGEVLEYVRYLRENPQEVELLFKEMLIGVTEFFRDPAVWERLRDDVVPELIEARSEGGTLRAWVAGCSTGEEAYSMAIILQEALEKAAPAQRIAVQIFATDLDKDAIDRARTGVYPAGIAKDVSEERLRKFFKKEEGGGYRVDKEIREMVVFAPQNMISDAPFTKLDILSCRNLLIYFNAEMQKKLLPLFHYCLNPGGVLVLGSAETIGPATDLFTLIANRERIYRRLETVAPIERMHFPVGFKLGDGKSAAGDVVAANRPFPMVDLQAKANEFLLRNYAAVAVLVTEGGDIVYINGKTNRYLEPAAGRANWNLFVMAREELSHTLFEVFRRAIRKKEVLTVRELPMGANGGSVLVDITVHPISEPAVLKGMVMVVFSESRVCKPADGKVHPEDSKDQRLAELARDLRHSQEELQVLREEMQTTSEELKSSNEELQSANEELQSMNEELTTSKEEMQAMNEELQVVNQDLIIKLQDLSRTNNDMQNLLSSTDTATLFLDNELNVRWFAPQTADIIHLIASDVGRPVTDIVSRLDYPTLAEDTREVLRTLVPMKKEIPTKDGRWFAARIIPYRTKESMIDGLVITFLDITESVKLAAELADCRALLKEHNEKPGKGNGGS